MAYLVLSVAGLVGTWVFNAFAIVQMRDFVGDLVSSGPAVSSITVDLLVVAIAGSIFILVEGRRLGMRFAWVYVVLSGLTAFAFTFPLFLRCVSVDGRPAPRGDGDARRRDAPPGRSGRRVAAMHGGQRAASPSRSPSTSGVVGRPMMRAREPSVCDSAPRAIASSMPATNAAVPASSPAASRPAVS